MDTQHPGGDQAYAGVTCAIRAALNAIASTLQTPPDDGPALLSCACDLRQLRGAFTMLEIPQGAALLAEMERLCTVDRRESRRDAAPLLLRAVQELRAAIDPPHPQLSPLFELEAMTQELLLHATPPDDTPPAAGLTAATRSEGGADAGDWEEIPVPGAAPSDAAAEEIHLWGEWESGAAAREEGVEREGGTPKDRIKVPLKTVVQTLPQWWEDMLNPELLETLQDAFTDIAQRAAAGGLGEVAELALTLQRLVAKVNDEMLPMTVQMMYGVIEQGALKLGVLLLEDGHPRSAGEFGGLKLIGVFSDLKQLTHEVGEVTGNGAGDGRYASPPAPDGGNGNGAATRHAAAPSGLGRLEDLLIEANLLHSQLLPRVNMMKRQQRQIQDELAALRRGAAGDANGGPADAAPAGTMAAMLKANGALERLIAECEECLGRYRHATHELQRAILMDGAPEFPSPPSLRRFSAATDSSH